MLHADLSPILPEILVITSFPPRECGIATYSQDLISSLKNKFSQSIKLSVCSLESESEIHSYTDEVKLILNIDEPGSFKKLAENINANSGIRLLMLQHEFGLYKNKEEDLETFLGIVNKAVITVFHTVLPNPAGSLKAHVNKIAALSSSIIVMTNASAKILIRDYNIEAEKISVIAHGTHLVKHIDKEFLKNKYDLKGKKVLSTFGLISSGKSIETTLEALPSIIKDNPNVIFLVIGKTHPSVVKQEGFKYRNELDEIVIRLGIQDHVKFINYYLPLPELLEYLQLTDIYLFTSKDRNQAVSGTFSYALSCGCPIVSTSIPHAVEVLRNDAGIIIDFENSIQLASAVNRLFKNGTMRKNISLYGLHRIAPTAWENSAITHAKLFERIAGLHTQLKYNLPGINLDHMYKLTTGFGMIQFSHINQPDIRTGYTLDDNARALIAMCQHYELTRDHADIKYINIYFNFIKYCLQAKGHFLNYIDEFYEFTEQNYTTNLADSNGRAIWALGYLVSISNLLPENRDNPGVEAELTIESALMNVTKIHSTRAMAFIIKGLYYRNKINKSDENTSLIKLLADKLLQMYRHESGKNWNWYESYLTYANSILPEAMLCAWLDTCIPEYKEVAKTSFDFLLSKTFNNNMIKVISNKGWLHKENASAPFVIGGEQPIDVAYSILALNKFYKVFNDPVYLIQMKTAFNWFLGCNHLEQIIYNPCTGGCYDGLEDTYVNLNQGAESTVSYLMARLTIESNEQIEKKNINRKKHYMELVLQGLIF